MRRLNSRLQTNFISEKGSDSVHKTYVAYTPLDRYLCIAVSESYDNDVDINSAKLAVETVLTEFEKKPSMKKIKDYIKSANEQILLHSTKNILKASIMVIVSDYTRMRYGVCGNTKMHVFHENMLSFVSETQTKYEEFQSHQIDLDSDPSQIHNLTCYLGIGKSVRPYISPKISLIENSTILISTSNIWGLVTDIELLDAYENAEKNEEILNNVEELLLSRQGNQEIGSYTAAAIWIERTFKEDTQKIKKRKKLILFAIILLLLIALIASIVILSMRAMDRSKMSKIEAYDQKGTKYITYENYSKSLEQYEKADEISQKLSLNNGQYKKKKSEIKTEITDKLTLLTTILDAIESYEGKDYKSAKGFFTEVLQEANYAGEDSICSYAEEMLKEINIQLEVSQLVSLGDVYESTEDHKQALSSYNQALKLLKQTDDVETRGTVQLKIYDIKQILKELEAKKEEETAKEEEEKEKQEEEKSYKQLVKIQVQLASASKYLEEGNIEEAKSLHKKMLSIYNSIPSPSEEIIKIYTEIVALEQAISDAQVKKAEDALNKQLEKVQEYLLEAAEAEQKGKMEDAVALYEKALAIYKKQKIWNDDVEKIYENINRLTAQPTSDAENPESGEEETN